MANLGSPGSLRLLNAQRIFDVLIASGPQGVSRAEIARTTGLSKPTVSALVADLEAGGLARPVTADRSGPMGRPATPYAISPDAGFVLAVDINAAATTLGIIDLRGTIRAEREVKTGPDAEAALAQVVAGADELQDETGTIVSFACIGVPGVYRQAEGRVDEALNLPGLDGMRVADRLEAALGVPVHVDNDVNLAARGEESTISDDDRSDFIAVAVGTGIGAGLVLGGQLYRGGNDAAGEIGKFVVAPHDHDARTLEDIASGPGIERAFRRIVADGSESRLSPTPHVGEILTAASTGDPASTAALAIAADAMARAIAHSLALLDPRRVVFGGDVGAHHQYVDAVRAALDDYTAASVDVIASTLGRRATFVGAAMHAVESLQSSIVGQRLFRTAARQNPPQAG